jgi:hypothetical protein
VSPAEFKVDDAVNMGALAKNVEVLASKLSRAAASIDSARDAGLMITRKKLVESMWGATKMQGILDGVRGRLESSTCPWSKVAVSAEVTSKSAERLCRKLSSTDPEDGRMLVNVLIPGINEGYSNIRSVAANAAISLVPLVYIDDASKRNTTYPATWFFDEDIMDGVSQGYDGILNFLLQIPAIESKVIDPLSFVRMRIIDGAK